ncbi:MAG: serine protease [Oligoflexales bacterium]
MSHFKVAIASAALVSTYTLARPVPTKAEAGDAAVKRMDLSRPGDVAPEFDFSGQIRFAGCSGSVVSFGQPKTANAVALTNGHCIGMMGGDPNAVIVNRPYASSANIYYNAEETVRAKTTKILYGIIQPHDIAFLELDKTYEELEKLGIRSRLVSPAMATVGTTIVLASGYWDSVATCDVEAIIFEIREDKWVNSNSYKYHCDAQHGTSGSPLINAETGEVVGANYTGNDDGEECTYNNPCEVDENGNINVDQGANYGDQVYKIMTCLNASKDIDLQVAGCSLPK